MKKYLLATISLCLAIPALSRAAGPTDITIPTSIETAFPGIQSNDSSVHFQRGGNDFQGMLLRNGTQNLSPAEAVTLGSTTIQCNKRVLGLYYNNQRGARWRPLDLASKNTLATIDSNYGSMSITGGLYTDCVGYNSQAVFGQVTQIFGANTFKLLAGVTMTFATNTYTTPFASTLLFQSNDASGYVYDSAGGIGQVLGVITNGTGNNGTGNNGGGNNGGGNNGGGGSNGGGSNGGGGVHVDNCPNGDNSPSYYDHSCGTPGTQHNPSSTGNSDHATVINLPIPEPKGTLCAYNDAQYMDRGPFHDITTHRAYPYIEMMRISCLQRGIDQNQWLYAPDRNMTRAEVVKTIAKIVGAYFGDFSISTEDQKYPTPTQFADVGQDYWFAWYADYAAKKGLLDGLVTSKNGKQYFHPDQEITRYEAIKVMMLAYDMIDKERVSLAGTSVMGDVIDPSNPYYQYIRKAEVLGFISGIPQTNGGYNFVGQKDITRAEFAKIISVPFTEQLFNLEDLVLQSPLYASIQVALEQSNTDDTVFLNALFAELNTLNDFQFVTTYKIQKKAFFEKLYEMLQN